MTFRKIISTLHLWLGLASGLVVFIVSVTGCIFVFEEELYSFFHRKLVYVSVPQNPVPLPASFLKSQAQDALSGSDNINAVNIYGDADKAYVFEVFNGSQSREESFFDQPGADWKRVYVNPYTGVVNGVFDMKNEFFITVRSIHQHLYLNPETGSPIVGTATIIFMILLVSGFVLWWPKNRSAARQRFWFKWKNTTKWKRRNYDLHNIPGFYSLILGLFIGLTGIVWSFQWWENAVSHLLDGRIVKSSLNASPSTSGAHDATVLDRKLEYLRGKHPDFLRIYLSENKNDNTLFAAVNLPGEDLWTHYDYHQYDLSSGKEFGTLMQADKTTGQKWRNSNYDLHTGKTLGIPGMILAFFASFVCASLPVTGFYIWWGRRHKRQKHESDRLSTPSSKRPIFSKT